MKKPFLLIILFLICSLSPAKTRKVPNQPKKPAVGLQEYVPPVVTTSNAISTYKFQQFFGLALLEKPAINMGFHLGHRLWEKKRYYLGPWIDFSLVDMNTKLLQTMGCVLFEFEDTRPSRYEFIVGAMAGVAFSQGMSSLNNTGFATSLLFEITKEIDDLASLGLLLRAGWLQSRLALFAGASVTFRL